MSAQDTLYQIFLDLVGYQKQHIADLSFRIQRQDEQLKQMFRDMSALKNSNQNPQS